MGVRDNRFNLPGRRCGRVTRVLGSTRGKVVIYNPLRGTSFSTTIVGLTRGLGCPVVTSPLSRLEDKLRRKDFVVSTCSDFLGGSSTGGTLGPSIVVHFNTVPMSGPLAVFVGRGDATHRVVISKNEK